MKLKDINTLVIGLFTSLLVLVLTTLKSIEVLNKTDIENISCGWPLTFIEQNQGRLDPPFPWKVNCQFFSLEFPTQYNWINFGLDMVFYFLVTIAVLKIFLMIRTSERKWDLLPIKHRLQILIILIRFYRNSAVLCQHIYKTPSSSDPGRCLLRAEIAGSHPAGVIKYIKL